MKEITAIYASIILLSYSSSRITLSQLITNQAITADYIAKLSEPPVLIVLLQTPATLPNTEFPYTTKLYLTKQFIHAHLPDQINQFIRDEDRAEENCKTAERERVKREIRLGRNSIPERPCYVYYQYRPSRRASRNAGADFAREKATIDQILKDNFSFPKP